MSQADEAIRGPSQMRSTEAMEVRGIATVRLQRFQNMIHGGSGPCVKLPVQGKIVVFIRCDRNGDLRNR